VKWQKEIKKVKFFLLPFSFTFYCWARSSVAEQSPHKGLVVGSIPTEPTRKRQKGKGKGQKKIKKVKIRASIFTFYLHFCFLPFEFCLL
jgi:hypothetical protein